jgi:DhnA family fructose-bisphosphate aldolase class Ia
MALSPGKARRLRRLFDETGHTVMLPLDIIMPCGIFRGAEDTGKLVDMGCAAGVDAVILRWGEAKRFADRIDPDVALVVRLSGSTGLRDDSRSPVVLNGVEASVMIGGDAVCVDVTMGDDREQESLRMLAHVCEEAERLGMAVVAEVNIPGLGGPDSDSGPAVALAWAARTVQELGADLVKVQHPGSAAGVRQICELVDIPVVTAGGEPRDPATVLRAIDEAIKGGAAGTAVSRNVIGHQSPPEMQGAVIDLVRGRAVLDEVLHRLMPSASVR